MAEPAPPSLARSIGVWQATALNVANMVGIGPFVTIPLFLAAMNGPHAIVAWIIAAVLVVCDGLVWSELGAALPGSGGTYHFLKVIYGQSRWGRALPFLFLWQFLLTGTMELATGYIGMVQYVGYLIPGIELKLGGHAPAVIASVICLIVGVLLSRRIEVVGTLSLVFCAGTLLTVLIVVASGISHFSPQLLVFPKEAFVPSKQLFQGLAGAMLIAIYDYLGYYNVCHLGDEVRDPGRTIPRAVLLSVGLIAAIYLTMNISIISVIPWQEAMHSKHIASDFMEKLYGSRIAAGFTLLILWTSFACFFAATLGYSRIMFAAGRMGDFFRGLGQLQPLGQYPRNALWAVVLLTAVMCFFPLPDLVSAAVLGRIGVQFVAQIAGLHLLRKSRPEIAMPFRMWLYPLPSLIALVGWLFVLFTPSTEAAWYGFKPLFIAFLVNLSGVVAYLLWKRAAAGPKNA